MKILLHFFHNKNGFNWKFIQFSLIFKHYMGKNWKCMENLNLKYLKFSNSMLKKITILHNFLERFIYQIVFTFIVNLPVNPSGTQGSWHISSDPSGQFSASSYSYSSYFLLNPFKVFPHTCCVYKISHNLYYLKSQFWLHW